MTVFWIAAAAIAVAAMLGMLYPLLRGRGVTLEERSEYDIAVYKDQLSEIDRDLERGLLSDTQADAARVEIQRRMLEAAPDAKSANGGAATNRGRDLALASAVTLFCVGSGLWLYMDLGQPGRPDAPFAERNVGQEEQAQAAAEMSQMIDQLAARLAQKPDDLRGWVLLGRSYESQEDYANAAKAYKKAVELSNREAGAVGAYAEALVMAAGDHIPAEAVPLLEELREKDVKDPRSYFYLAAWRMSTGDQEAALQEWVNLIAVSPADAPWLAETEERVRIVAKNIGIDPATLKPTVAVTRLEWEKPAGAAPAEASGAPAAPSPEQMEAAAAMTEEERNDMIRSMVARLAERLEANPDDADGWNRLAQAYMVLGEVAKAAQARAKAEQAAK